MRTIFASDRRQWQELLNRFPNPDVYFTAEYHHPYECLGDGRACAFFLEEASDCLFYPFMLRPIDRVGHERVEPGLFDIQTIYGYSGPLSTTSDPRFLDHAWSRFGEWCRSQHVVAEFIRFHPLLRNHLHAGGDCRVSLNRETVAVDLAPSPEGIWANAPSIHRNMVRKAMAKGLNFTTPEWADAAPLFKDLYARTMARLGAEHYYVFPEEYYAQLCAGLPGRLRTFVVSSGQTPAAAGLFLLGTDQMHYHLSGSDERFQHAAPNNFLLHSAALWGRERGFRWLHLGGGRTNDPEDSLFRFKASISKTTFPFYIGTRVHLRKEYDALCSEWQKVTGCTRAPKYFLLYRLEK